MDLKLFLGCLILNSYNEEGLIIDIDKNIIIKFNNPPLIRKYNLRSLNNHCLILKDINKDLLFNELLNNEQLIISKINNKYVNKAISLGIKMNKFKRFINFNNYENNIRYYINKKVDKYYYPEYLKLNYVFTYLELEKLFDINIKYSGHSINIKDDVIILISSIKKVKSELISHDHYNSDGSFTFIGKGNKGNQKLNKSNKEIINARKNNKIIYLFIKTSKNKYFFQGRLSLLEYSFRYGYDINNNLRKEYRFRFYVCKEMGEHSSN